MVYIYCHQRYLPRIPNPPTEDVQITLSFPRRSDSLLRIEYTPPKKNEKMKKEEIS